MAEMSRWRREEDREAMIEKASKRTARSGGEYLRVFEIRSGQRNCAEGVRGGYPTC
jgi:hypothetical protein